MESVQLDTPIRSVAVLTSGGDAPGMNAGVRAVVRAGIVAGLKMYGIQDGYQGLINGDIVPLGRRDVSNILSRGGTFLRTARCAEMMTPHGQREAVRQLYNEGIDGLIVIGGDGTMAGAQSISAQGYPVVAIPGTIDNDVYGTDTCIGVDTALNTIMEAIDKIRDTAASHSRAFLVQTMGRDSGFLAVESALISGAEMALIPENPNITVEEIAQTIANSYKRGRRHCIIVVAEGFPIPMDELTVKLDAMDLGFKARGTNLSYIQRGGTPSAFDRLIASRMGFKAIEFLTTGKFNVMTALQGRDIVPLPIPELVGKHRGFPEEYLKISNILSR